MLYSDSLFCLVIDQNQLSFLLIKQPFIQSEFHYFSEPYIVTPAVTFWCFLGQVSLVFFLDLDRCFLNIHIYFSGNMAAFDMSLPEAVVSPGENMFFYQLFPLPEVINVELFIAVAIDCTAMHQ